MDEESPHYKKQSSLVYIKNNWQDQGLHFQNISSYINNIILKWTTVTN